MENENKKKSDQAAESNKSAPNISPAEYGALLKRLEELENSQKELKDAADLAAVQNFGRGWQKVGEEKITRTATILKFRPDTNAEYSYVIDWKFLKRVRNAERQRMDDIYQITILGEDLDIEKAETTQVVWLDFCLESERETVEILEMTKEPFKKVYGKVRKVKTEWEKYLSMTTDELVDLDVVQESIVCKVKLENGKTIVLPANRLNN